MYSPRELRNMAASSSPSSRFNVHVGPTSLHVITAAASSLHLGNFLRRRIHHQGFLLPSSSAFNLKHISYLGHLSCLRDGWLERAFPDIGFNVLRRSYYGISGAFMSLFFFGGEGSGNSSSNSTKPSSELFSDGRKWTHIMLGVNVAVYAAQIATRGKLLLWGAKINSLIDKGQIWRLVTSSFLHANLVHLMLNCFALRGIGPAVEDLSGPRRYLAVYFTSAITSSAMSYWLCKSSSVGASGAIFGLIGANTVFLLRHKDIIADSGQHLQNIMTVIAINVVLGISVKSIDNWGHIGGFLGGVATSWLLGPSFKLQYISSEGRKRYIDKPPISAVSKLTRPTEE